MSNILLLCWFLSQPGADQQEYMIAVSSIERYAHISPEYGNYNEVVSDICSPDSFDEALEMEIEFEDRTKYNFIAIPEV